MRGVFGNFEGNRVEREWREIGRKELFPFFFFKKREGGREKEKAPATACWKQGNGKKIKF